MSIRCACKLSLLIRPQAIKATIKKISSVGLNPGAIWTQLSLLRGTVSSSVLTFPDPDAISSRTSRNRTANAITSSKQLLPIIVALIEIAIQGDSVREEIDNGLADIKEKNKHFAALKRDEHQRWQDETLKYNEEKAEGEKKEGWDAKKWSKQVSDALYALRNLCLIWSLASRGFSKAQGVDSRDRLSARL